MTTSYKTMVVDRKPSTWWVPTVRSTARLSAAWPIRPRPAQAWLALGRGELRRCCLWLSRAGLRPQTGRRSAEPAGIRFSRQCIISSAYDEEFRTRDLLTSLVLLTRPTRRAVRLTCTRALPAALVEWAVPVVNENDTVTVDEIKFSDNDTLAALVAAWFR
ncbi:MAG: hypothetical protein ACLU0O_01865 [Collinsella sp.]